MIHIALVEMQLNSNFVDHAYNVAINITLFSWSVSDFKIETSKYAKPEFVTFSDAKHIIETTEFFGGGQ